MAYGPVPSSRMALERAGLSVDDVSRWEINEAFAGQAVACMKDLGIDERIVNVNGGAVGLGHPLAATGTRLHYLWGMNYADQEAVSESLLRA